MHSAQEAEKMRTGEMPVLFFLIFLTVTDDDIFVNYLFHFTVKALLALDVFEKAEYYA